MNRSPVWQYHLYLHSMAIVDIAGHNFNLLCYWGYYFAYYDGIKSPIHLIEHSKYTKSGFLKWVTKSSSFACDRWSKPLRITQTCSSTGIFSFKHTFYLQNSVIMTMGIQMSEMWLFHLFLQAIRILGTEPMWMDPSWSKLPPLWIWTQLSNANMICNQKTLFSKKCHVNITDRIKKHDE